MKTMGINKYWILLFVFCVSISCKDKRQDDLQNYASDQVSDEEKAILGINEVEQSANNVDADTVMITDNKLNVVKTQGKACFMMNIDLPNYENVQVNENIMQWINQNLDEKIPNTAVAENNEQKTKDFEAFRMLYNLNFEGDVLDFVGFASFYQEKYAKLLQGHRSKMTYLIDCVVVFESKDIVSYEIRNYTLKGNEKKGTPSVRGASFFKYDGSLLDWRFFVGTEVKTLVKQEINTQSLKLDEEDYEHLLQKSKYEEFSLPDNPPYVTLEGLKFVYGKREWNPGNDNRQTMCIIPVEQFNFSEQLEPMLK